MPEPTAGATPVVAGANPPQTPPAQPAPATSEAPPPATDGTEALGDAGKRALDAMKAEAKAAKAAAAEALRELEALRSQSLSESEKAIATAKKEGLAEATATWTARVRAAEVRAGLTAVGIAPDMLALAALAPEFATLAVDDTGAVAELDKAVTAFKGTHPSLFAKPAPGSFDTGTGGRTAKPVYTRAQINDPAFYDKNRDDILAALGEGRVAK